jgi:integrase
MPRITEDFIRRFSLRGREEVVVRDSQLTGFCARFRRRKDNSVSLSFFAISEMAAVDNKRRRRKILIGDYPTWPADRARAEAAEMLRAIDRGEDPKAQREDRRAQPTFAELVTEFEARHFPDLKPASRKDYQGRIRRVLLPTFGKIRVCDVTSPMVRDMVLRKRANPTDANRALAVMSSMMSLAVEHGWRADNPCKGVKRYKEKPREHWLDEHDLPKFLAALAQAKGPHAEAIRFLTVTGWRVSEVTGLRWDMVDLPRMIARLPDTKTGQQVRALSTDAAALVDRQQHRHGYVFSPRGGWSPVGYTRVRHALTAVCEAAGIVPITPHVLRHTAATWAAVNGAEAHELREAFGWKTLAMTARYVSKSEALARRGAERAAGAINIFNRPAAKIVKVRADG